MAALLKPARLLRRGSLGLVAGDQLSLADTFTNGQIWGWRAVHEPSVPPGSSGKGSDDTSIAWRGVLGPMIVSLKTAAASSAQVNFELHCSSDLPDADLPDESVSTSLLRSFLNADTSMAALHTVWSAGDPRIATIASCVPGMRILNQDAWECLVSFICSSNNNILRIGQMLEKLREKYGTPIGTLDGAAYYQFPTPATLKDAPQPDLRALGLGYRDKFVIGTAKKVVDELGGRSYFDSLKSKGSLGLALEVQEALVQFDGVGQKVADCVALFSCNCANAIPCDTHVWQIACCYYDPTLTEAKSLTPAVYKRVGDLFRTRFGSHAGWAHSLLFAAEINAFKNRLPAGLREQMDAFKAKEGERKAVVKKEAAERKLKKLEQLKAKQAETGEKTSEPAGAAEPAPIAAVDSKEVVAPGEEAVVIPKSSSESSSASASSSAAPAPPTVPPPLSEHVSGKKRKRSVSAKK